MPDSIPSSEALLLKLQRAAQRAGLKESVGTDDLANFANISGVYVEAETGRLIGADAAIRQLKKDRPGFFKNARDLTDEEFARKLSDMGVRSRI